MRRYCRICGFRDALPGERYCSWCDGTINKRVRGESKPKKKLSDPSNTVRGLSRLLRRQERTDREWSRL